MSGSRLADLQRAILNAIRLGSGFNASAFSGMSAADGYWVQAETFRELGEPLRGSKLALKPDACHSAPLLRVSEADRHAYQPEILIEVEFAFVLGRDIAGGSAPVTRDEVVSSVSSIHIGVELCRSRYNGGSRGDQALSIADMMSNSGYILGTPLDRSLLERGVSVWQLSVLIDGNVAFDEPAVHADGDPLQALLALANQPPLTGHPILTKGQIITTGSLCGMIPIMGPGTIDVRLGGERFELALYEPTGIKGEP